MQLLSIDHHNIYEKKKSHLGCLSFVLLCLLEHEKSEEPFVFIGWVHAPLRVAR